MMNISVGVEGQYVLAILKDGKEKFRTDPFDNAITDAGMDLLGTDYTAANSNFLRYCRVRTLLTTPAVASQVCDADVTIQVETTARYAYYDMTYTFPVGAAEGSIQYVETGTDPIAGVTFSQTQVRDAKGSPVTVTVLSDEQLVVRYQFRIYQPTVDLFNASAGDYNAQVKTANAGLVQIFGWYGKQSASGVGEPRNTFQPNGYTGTIAAAYTGGVGGIASVPTGLQASYTTPDVSYSADPYTPGTFYRRFKVSFSANVANDPSGVGAIAFALGSAFFQVGFTPVMLKLDSLKLVFEFRLTWTQI